MSYRSHIYMPRRNSEAAVLIVTLWIVLGIAALILVFSRSVRVETIAAGNEVAALQADAVARGALQYAMAHLDGRQGAPPVESETPCEAAQIGDGFFWILRPPKDDETGYSFGIVAETSKLNLNIATPDMLLKLPNMTSDVAASIKAWRDPASVLTPEGAESDYYLSLPDPYNCKNSLFETVEELFLVKGVTATLLFGQDVNRNGVLDSAETGLPASAGAQLGTGRPDSGLYNFLTVYGVEPNTSADGAARVNLNNASLQALSSVLQQALSGARLSQVAQLARSGRPFRNVLDFYFRAGLTAAEFGPIADRLTTRSEGTLNGLVNVNTAPRAVLLCLPGLDAGDVDALVSKRGATGADLSSIAWVVEALPRDKAIAVADLITVRSYQYSADIVAVSGNGRAYKRYRAVLDTRNTPPKVVYWKDLTYLGWPLSPDIQSALRLGGPPSMAAFSSVGNPT